MDKVDKKDHWIQRSEFITAGEEIRLPDTPASYIKHEGYEIIIILSGSGVFQIEDRIYPVKKGDLFFIAEGEYHKMSVTRKVFCQYVDFRPSLLFNNPAVLRAFLSPFLNCLNRGSHRLAHHRELFGKVKSLIESVRGGPADAYGIFCEVVKLMEAFQRLKLPRVADSGTDSKALRPALDMIYRNYQGPLAITRMAESCRMSTSTFFRRFMAVYGKNPKSYLLELRINQASAMIRQTKRKISDIALEAGFPNLSNFNRAFLKKTGKSPLMYRQAG
jgi:AraC-like DNA-binding protein